MLTGVGFKGFFLQHHQVPERKHDAQTAHTDEKNAVETFLMDTCYGTFDRVAVAFKTDDLFYVFKGVKGFAMALKGINSNGVLFTEALLHEVTDVLGARIGVGIFDHQNDFFHLTLSTSKIVNVKPLLAASLHANMRISAMLQGEKDAIHHIPGVIVIDF